MIRAVFLLILFGLFASAGYACECEIVPISKKFRKAKAVFVGEVVEISRNDLSKTNTVVVKLKVERRWKEAKEQFVTVVGLPAAAGLCGLGVELNKKYLIYAFRMEDQLESSFCDSRSLEHAAEDLSVIGKGKPAISH